MNFIGHWLGLDNSSGPIYLSWSGFISDIGELALIAGLIGLFKKHNCHVKGCWRLGLHPVSGTPYITCKKHHPLVPEAITAEHIAAMHKMAEKGSE